VRINRFIALAVGVVAIAATAYVLVRSADDLRATTTTTSTAVAVVSRYDLTEAPDDVDLATLRDAKFASILLRAPEGLTSYMIAADQEAFTALAQAVAAAKEAQGPAPGTSSTLTFVLPDRVTVTFVIDLTTGLIAREGTVWRPQGDLASLIRAITTQADTT